MTKSMHYTVIRMLREKRKCRLILLKIMRMELTMIKSPLFIDELRRENPANLFLDEDGDPLDDDTIMRRYYGDYKRTLTWHGKKFEQEEQERKNRQTMGQAEIKSTIYFCKTFGNWEIIPLSCLA